MSAKSALVITDGAYSVDADGKKTGTAVNLEGGVANSVVNDGGKVILAGKFTAADSNIPGVLWHHWLLRKRWQY